MNLIKTKLFAVMILFIVTSCASQSVPQKLDDFVNKVEQNSSAYSQSDWEKTAMEYQRLVDVNFDSFCTINAPAPKFSA